MKKINTALFLCLVFFAFSSFTSSINNTLVPHQIQLNMDKQLGLIYMHKLQKNQTIYGLAKFFNIEIHNIIAANPGIQLEGVKQNQRINIPIKVTNIESQRSVNSNRSYIPVYYTVKQGETLYRISKVYFSQHVQDVKRLNGLKSESLSIGQRLLIGWFAYDLRYKNKVAWKAPSIEVAASKTVRTYLSVDEKRSHAARVKQKDRPRFQKIVKVRKSETLSKDEPQITADIRAIKKVAKKAEEGISYIKVNADDKIVIMHKNSEPTKLDLDLNNNESTDDAVAKTATSNEEDLDILEKEEAKEELRLLSDEPFERMNGIYKGNYDDKPTVVEKKISAQWNSKSKDKTSLFALHATARINSFIEIHNPMLGTTVVARVVGNIPDRIYKRNVELIVAPKVAKTLGVIDKKFFVKIKYIE